LGFGVQTDAADAAAAGRVTATAQVAVVIRKRRLEKFDMRSP
jgi:hypothetical protein